MILDKLEACRERGTDSHGIPVPESITELRDWLEDLAEWLCDHTTISLEDIETMLTVTGDTFDGLR